MKSQVLSNFQWQELTVLAFIIFIVFFVGVVIRTFSKERYSILKSASNLPFEEGTPVGEGKNGK